MMRPFPLSLLLCSTVLLAGCQTAAVAVATPIMVQKRHLNLTNASYAAIETLVGQTNQRIDPLKPFVITDLQEIIHDPDNTGLLPPRKIHKNPELSRVMTEQMRGRLLQLGYRVLQPTSSAHTVQNVYEMIGNYYIDHGNIISHGGSMQVALQLIDRAENTIISTHTFAVPITDEVRRYMASGNVLVPKFLRD